MISKSIIASHLSGRILLVGEKGKQFLLGTVDRLLTYEDTGVRLWRVSLKQHTNSNMRTLGIFFLYMLH